MKSKTLVLGLLLILTNANAQVIKNEAFSLSNSFGDLQMRRYATGDMTFKRALVPNATTLDVNYAGDFSDGVRIQGSKLRVDGNLGIGTPNPSEKLEITGGNIKVLSYNASRYLRFTESGFQGAFINYDGIDNVLKLGINNVADEDTNNDVSILNIIRSTANVGIGTTDTQGFKLGVNGKIAATEVKVAAYGNWADFVFEDDYNLPTLKEVENHIKDKGHLRGIPSAEEVAENGFFLGEMDAKLLQKIEELTLYTIEQDKKIEIQKEKIEKIERQNTMLKSLLNRVEELEKLIQGLNE